MKRLLYLFFFCLIFGCKSSTPYDHIESYEVRELLKKAIVTAGGLEAWNNLGRYEFNKRTILYNPDGSVEVKNAQVLTIKDFPELSGTITWNNQGDTVQTNIQYNAGKAIKHVDNIPQSEDVNEAARLTFLGAHIVMTMPFKLLDPGVKLSYGGLGKQYDKSVEIIIADYDSDQPNHTKSHRWSTKLKGIPFPTDRITWRVDSLDNKKYIRGKFAYSDFKTVD